MRGTLVGTGAGLVVGALVALTCSHWMGEGRQLVETRSQLADTVATLTRAADEKKLLKSEADSQAVQIHQLTATNSELKLQLAEFKARPPVVSSGPEEDDLTKAATARYYKERLLILKSRLKLTPAQLATLQAEIDARSKAAKGKPGAPGTGGELVSWEKTLTNLLTPDQKAVYGQFQQDEINSQAEDTATMEINELSPLLQLNDAQKDQVFAALYQNQQNAMNPVWIKGHVSNSVNGTNIFAAQDKANVDALAKVLTPGQLAIYRQHMADKQSATRVYVHTYTLPSTASAAP